MSNRCKVIVLVFSIFFLNLTRGVSQTIENNKENNKSSIELIKDIERIIHSLEEKDSLKISAYVDYGIDSIICQETDVKEKFEILRYLSHDDFNGYLSLRQKNRLIDEILKGRYYNLCVSGYGYNSIWYLPFCPFLIKNESDKIRDSIRKAEKELSQSACDNCTVEEHKLFYRYFLLYLHDNRTIDWLFKNLIDASKSNKRIDTNDFLIIPFDLEWFKYRKEEVFEVLCDVIRTNKNAYVKYQWYCDDCDGDDDIFYQSLEFCLINNIDKFIKGFPDLEDDEDIIIQKYKGHNFWTFSEKYKQRVIKWMEKHKSDYVYER